MSDASLLDAMLCAVADVHRRRVLLALTEENPQHAEDLVVGEDELLDRNEAERRQIALFHNQLPRLEDTGFIRWENETHTVRKGPRFEEIRPLLEFLKQRSDSLLHPCCES